MKRPLMIFHRPFFQVLAASCGLVCCGLGEQEVTVETGVHLVLSSEQLEPTTTFELRFDEPAVAAEKVGLPAKDSPLVVAPPLAGSFVWLSQRSGVFTPSAPPALGTSYRFTLAPGLKKADGTPLDA